ncbi:MAG: 16S rRNA (cytidine(1402)-2'-O)-methyltransferase [Proteobacteria bacterium]|nr:16S rRNA (cytidine(1402)-2'-O)-methyltransferase [Pseudomonadota bacterium]
MSIPPPGTLYIVATPIGNLDDISKRALDVLHNVDFILCEDTRHSSVLLDRFQIRKRLVSYFSHNEALRTEQIIPSLLEGQSAALITDAGTPGISDPGARLVDACHKANVRVCPIPGACAVAAALSACGFYDYPGYRFMAFFPRKSSERIALFESFREDPTLMAGYESPQRIVSLLEDLVSVLGPERRVCLARELTKKYETIVRTSAQSLLEQLRATPCKGELCLVIEGNPKVAPPTTISDDASRMIACLKAKSISSRDIRDIVSEYFGIKPKIVYQHLLNNDD